VIAKQLGLVPTAPFIMDADASPLSAKRRNDGSRVVKLSFVPCRGVVRSCAVLLALSLSMLGKAGDMPRWVRNRVVASMLLSKGTIYIRLDERSAVEGAR
jgi:hypothetical protein